MQSDADHARGHSAWAERVGWIVDTLEGGNASAVARRAGLTPQAITRIARGGSPTGDTLASLLRAYPSLSAEWLMLGREPRLHASAAHDRFSAAVLEAVQAFEAALANARRRYLQSAP